jgi:cell division protein FtsL
MDVSIFVFEDYSLSDSIFVSNKNVKYPILSIFAYKLFWNHLNLIIMTIFLRLQSTTQTLTTHAHSPLWTPSKTELPNPQDWQNHHRRLAIDDNTNTHCTRTLIPMNIFEGCADKSSRLTKSPQAPRCWREHHLPLKTQPPLNPENSIHKSLT